MAAADRKQGTGAGSGPSPPVPQALAANLKRVLDPVGLKPGDSDLYVTAFTHASYRSDHPGASDNERLEFLGDAVLELVVSDYLFQADPELGEGPLTRMRSLVVRTGALARAARRLDLPRHLRVSRGEAESGGLSRPSLLSDLFEALVGAVYLDHGFAAAHRFICHHLQDELRGALARSERRDSKSRLQERVQQRYRTGEPPLTYAVVDERGPGHARHFTVEVRLFDRILAQGEGSTKQAAEQSAAAAALAQLQAAEDQEGTSPAKIEGSGSGDRRDASTTELP